MGGHMCSCTPLRGADGQPTRAFISRRRGPGRPGCIWQVAKHWLRTCRCSVAVGWRAQMQMRRCRPELGIQVDAPLPTRKENNLVQSRATGGLTVIFAGKVPALELAQPGFERV